LIKEQKKNVEDKIIGEGIKHRLLPLGEKEGKWGVAE
jgi:hypothetical protein